MCQSQNNCQIFGISCYLLFIIIVTVIVTGHHRTSDDKRASYLFVCPGVGEPPDDSRLQLFGNPSEGHVLLDAIHAVLELYPGHIHVADHAAYVAHDRSKNEHTGEEIGHHEHVFQFVFRLRCFSCEPKALSSELSQTRILRVW